MVHPIVSSGFPEIAEPGKAGTHIVQFYESDAFLARVVAEFIADGFAADQPAVIIATPEHREAICSALGFKGIDVKRMRIGGYLTLLDAAETLALFMEGGAPSRALFRDVIGDTLRKIRRDGKPGIRAYGEMVDLLWRANNIAAALSLENLWCELSHSLDFSLLCAYKMANFYKATDGTELRAICESHTHVRPTERYSEASGEMRLIEIALLQQRALSLENEIEAREELENQLRTTVLSLNARETEREHLLERERTARADAERARAAAEQANRVKSEFLAVMSHELRTPLNAISGYAELMQLGVHGVVTDGQAEALERIQRSQRHLLGLINQVLNYARLETGTVRYEFSDVPVDEILRTADALVMPQMRARALHFSYVPCESGLCVRADAEKLQQIILNLLANAVKFTDRGGEVRVECERKHASVIIRIVDSGIGIPSEKIGVIFDPFVQVDSNFTRTKEGVGLGLAISRDLARGMGGDLFAESVLGEGTSMSLELPIAPR